MWPGAPWVELFDVSFVRIARSQKRPSLRPPPSPAQTPKTKR